METEKATTSNLIPSVSALQTFFSKRISSLTLLFRASEHDFSICEFHRKCDGADHTITVLETQFGKVIGGYNPLAWSSDRDILTDHKQESFLFSLTDGRKLELQCPEPAIRTDQLSGPHFGDTDLHISDDANLPSSTSTYYPGVYGTNKEASHKRLPFDEQQKLAAEFTGQAEGPYFQIKDWEVLKITFGK
jgi:hypothetical protein